MEGLDLNTMGMVLVFLVGYVFITLEHYTHVNKTTVALMMAITCWILQFTNPHAAGDYNQKFFGEHLSNISQVVFFLLGAMTIVEIISVHNGFNVILPFLQVASKKKLLWVIGFLAFFLSSILDNLTTTVVMLSLINKLIDGGEDKLLLGGAVVVAANAGGAWTPIGDVTTTMLWIGGQISTLNIMKLLFLPSLGCLVAALLLLTPKLKGNLQHKTVALEKAPLSTFVFYFGIGSLVFVPIFRLVTGLPAFMGMLFGLSALWLITDLAHHRYRDRDLLRVPSIISRIDLAGVLFFLGILLCIDALDTAQVLHKLATYLNRTIGNDTLIATAIGLASAVVDNVPLVAATMGMYDLAGHPADHSLWTLIAYCAGTGGSVLLIGSAAGVVLMGIDQVNFVWYLKRITLPATVGFFTGILIYQLTYSFFS